MEFNEIRGGGSCKNLILVLIFSKLTSHLSSLFFETARLAYKKSFWFIRLLG